MESEDPGCVGIAGRKATLLGHVEIAPQRASGKLQSLGGTGQPREGRHLLEAPNNTVTLHTLSVTCGASFRIVVWIKYHLC